MLYGIYQGIHYFLQILYYLMLAYCLLSWILPPYHRVMTFLARFVDPLLRPIRNLMFRIFPRMPLDLSALVAFFAIRLLDSLLLRLYLLLA
ncbi:MAG: YggT family protein [Oscillospiraceae bacterium]|jgi:uncharacterized protein YggT (Ycf19 family)|nr:YggT family protein [Oscillospiraceae bacterium]